MELGVEPGMSLDGTPVSLSLPVTLGISLADYYESPDLKVGRSSANRHNLRGASSPSVSE